MLDAFGLWGIGLDERFALKFRGSAGHFSQGVIVF
jgi:hypothetical protein